MAKKLILALMALAILVPAAIFANGQDEAATATGVEVNPAGTFPIVDQQITLTIFRSQDPRIVDYIDNAHYQWLLEKTNVAVNWQLVPSQQATDKMNLILASGTDLPDVFMQGMGNEMILKYSQEGVFVPLNDLVDEYGVNVKKVQADLAEEGVDFLKTYTAPDGNIYGFPFVNMCEWCRTIFRCWVDTRFMENLGLEMPSTVDEFHDMLVAFKTEDPNGNGKRDEIPLMGARQGWGTQVEGYLMMPFIVYNAGNGDRLILDDETGKVTAAYTDPRWLDGVRWIRSLIEEGLLDPVSLTQTRQEYQVMGETEPAIVGTFLQSNFQGLTVQDDKYKNFEAIPPLQGVDTGRPQTYRNRYQGLSNSQFMITDSCENPAAAFRWMDVWYTEEGSMWSRYGKEGEDWVRVSEGTGPFGDPAWFKEIAQWGAPTKNSLRQMHGYISKKIYSGLAMVDNSDSYYVMRTSKYDPYGIGNSVPRFFILPEEVDEYSELKQTLDTYVDETFARLVTGDLPLSYWDEFQEELQKIGLDRFIELTENAYKRQYM